MTPNPPLRSAPRPSARAAAARVMLLLVLAALGLLVALAGFLGLSGAALPYQDATPELLRYQAEMVRTWQLILWAGLAVLGLGLLGAWLARRAQRRAEPYFARLWHTRIDPARSADYDRFVEEHSRPMFAALPGCLGAFFLGDGEMRHVLTLWADAAAIEDLATDPRYRSTVKRLSAAGILRDPQTVEVYPVSGGTVSWEGLAAAFETRATD